MTVISQNETRRSFVTIPRGRNVRMSCEDTLAEMEALLNGKLDKPITAQETRADVTEQPSSSVVTVTEDANTDATENSSSFGDTISKDEVTSVSSDAEVEPEFRADSDLFDGFSSVFPTRWTKKEYRTLAPISDANLVHDYDASDVVKLEISNVWSEFYATIDVVKDMSEQHIKDLASVLKSFREKVCSSFEPLTKEKEVEKLLGYNTTAQIRTIPPRKSENKGSGKRLISDREVAISKVQKQKRLCQSQADGKP